MTIEERLQQIRLCIAEQRELLDETRDFIAKLKRLPQTPNVRSRIAHSEAVVRRTLRQFAAVDQVEAKLHVNEID